MFPQDVEILEDLVLTRNLSEQSEKIYEQVIKRYTEYYNTPLKELLSEAETEEEQGIRWKKRKLRTRLLEFRNHLYNNYMDSTAKMNFSKILTIYKHYEIEVYKLPPVSQKQSSKTLVYFDDLPTKDIIRKALDVARPIHKRIILFQISTGCGMAEILNLKIQDLLDSVKEYYTGNDVYEMIGLLMNRDDVIPCFRLRRQKTGKIYYTFCTNECFKSLCMYLLTRKSLRASDRVFKITQLHLMQLFREVNDLLGLGTVNENGYVRFRSHMLRKFHASALYNDGMRMETVNDLQGKSKNKTDSSYFLEDPRKLKDEYVKHMGVLVISSDFSGSDGVDDLVELKSRILKLEKLLNDSMGTGELDLMDKFF